MGKRDTLGVWDWHKHTIIYKTNNYQGPTTVEHKELYLAPCDDPYGKRI